MIPPDDGKKHEGDMRTKTKAVLFATNVKSGEQVVVKLRNKNVSFKDDQESEEWLMMQKLLYFISCRSMQEQGITPTLPPANSPDSSASSSKKSSSTASTVASTSKFRYTHFCRTHSGISIFGGHFWGYFWRRTTTLILKEFCDFFCIFLSRFFVLQCPTKMC